MKINELLKQGHETLSNAGVDNPNLDLRILLANALNVSQEHIIGNPEKEVGDSEVIKFNELVTRREQRIPIAKILGVKEFWGLEFKVNKYVLDPRPDSETLIEAVLESCSDRSEKLKILDVGTGSGCLLISLLSEYKNATGVGVDISKEALAIARDNAVLNTVDSRANFVESDLFENLGEQKFDIIVSNPPYIPSKDILELEPEVAQHDPMLALDGGEEGLDYYCKIIAGAPRYTDTIFFEVGVGQADSVVSIMVENSFADTKKYKDLAGVDRCVSGSI